jgi:hypothetical protein
MPKSEEEWRKTLTPEQDHVLRQIRTGAVNRTTAATTTLFLGVFA